MEDGNEDPLLVYWRLEVLALSPLEHTIIFFAVGEAC